MTRVTHAAYMQPATVGVLTMSVGVNKTNKIKTFVETRHATSKSGGYQWQCGSGDRRDKNKSQCSIKTIGQERSQER